MKSESEEHEILLQPPVALTLARSLSPPLLIYNSLSLSVRVWRSVVWRSYHLLIRYNSRYRDIMYSWRSLVRWCVRRGRRMPSCPRVLRILVGIGRSVVNRRAFGTVVCGFYRVCGLCQFLLAVRYADVALKKNK